MPRRFARCDDAADGTPRAHPAATLTAWPAPVATAPVDATVRLPGSKSVTNRALVLGALAPGRTTLRGALRARDTELMAAALTALGSPVSPGDEWTVDGAPAGAPVAADRVDLGNAGTVARFVPAVAALRSGDVVLDGDPRIRERPVGPLLTALRALGAQVDGEAFPVTVRGRGVLPGGGVTLDASTSSQLVSGLLLAGPSMVHGLVVRHSGPPVPSRPHLDMTVAMMRWFGADVAVDGDVWTVRPGAYQPRDVAVEPDLSGAAPFLAAAAVTGGVVRVEGWPRATTQPGAAIPALLAEMGCSYDLDGDTLVLRGGPLRGVDADLRHCPEAAPVLAAVACVAAGPTALRGIAHLRLQETDRLAALATELTKLGASVTDTDDGLEVRPGPLRGGEFATYDDHRLVMAAAVLGLVVPGVVVADVETVGKTMPDFAERWQAMLG
ncbi:MAG TPA: 3-phosphoshikimate 1-carboxyvinyltransferase [Frankiaceae bacterium]|nr:3-phosphoshikimate 1-carboxyvinyltransferase [Frankiaceae bacterium]